MNTAIERIIHGKTVVAIIVRASFDDERQFVTSEDSPMQLGARSYPKNHTVLAHHHADIERTITQNQEFLYITSGVVKARFYLGNGQVGATIVKTGDMILQMCGGHSFEMIEASRIVMIKQGPYIGEKEKVFIEIKEV